MADPSQPDTDPGRSPSNRPPITSETTRSDGRFRGEFDDEAIVSLEDRLRGALVLPDAAEYDESRQV